jgi:hypothetical protein
VDLSPPALGRRIPLLGLLLIIAASVRFTSKSGRVEPDWGFVAVLIAMGILTSLTTHACDRPIRCRILLATGLLMHLVIGILRLAAYWGPQGFQSCGLFIGLVTGMLSSLAMALGACALWGSALALREDPGHRTYSLVSVGGAFLSIGGLVVSLISEVGNAVQFRGQYLSSLQPSIAMLLTTSARVSLFVACVFACRGSSEPSEQRLRVNRVILFMLLWYLSTVGLWLHYLAPDVLRSPGRFIDRPRFLWLAAINLTLFLLNPILLSLCFRKPKPGYNSATTPHPQTGAGA